MFTSLRLAQFPDAMKAVRTRDRLAVLLGSTAGWEPIPCSGHWHVMRPGQGVSQGMADLLAEADEDADEESCETASGPLLTLDDPDGCRGYRSDCAEHGHCHCDRLGRE